MKILVFEPMKKPYVKDIKDNIHAMQKIVGGSIEPIYFEPKQDAIVWCNDEFLLNGSEPNRIVGEHLSTVLFTSQATIKMNMASGIAVHLPMNRLKSTRSSFLI